MPRRVTRKAGGTAPTRRRRKRAPWFWPGAPLRRRWIRAFRRAPIYTQVVVGVTLLALTWATVNWTYQVVRKPTELFFPVSGTLSKTPAQTWAAYAPIFRAHATKTITPEFLAALAQIEGSGNPVARTYWRWSFSFHPLEIYRPASSAVGMYQFTDGTFAEAKRLCIHAHHVVADGPWYAWRSCWFNALYSRVIPSNAVEMASAYLDANVDRVLKQHRIAAATAAQKQNTAALMHLCGAGAAADYVGRGFKLTSAQRCGDHPAKQYVERFSAMQAVFSRLARDPQ
jgi:Transglycosylase SLT domain